MCLQRATGSNSAEGLAPSSIGQVTSFQLAQRWYEESKSHGREARFDQAVHALHETLRLWPLHSQANRDLGTLLSSVTLTPRGSAAGRYATRSVAGVNAHVGAHRDWAESQFRQLLDAVVLSDLSLWNREQRLVWQTPVRVARDTTCCWRDSIIHYCVSGFSSWQAEDLTAGQALTRAQHVALLTVTPPLQGAPCDVMQPITDWISGPDVHSVTPMPAEASTSTHHSPPEHDIATGQHAFLVRLHNVTVSGWEPVVWGPCHVYLPVHGPFISLILGEHGFQNTSSLDGRPMRHVHLDEAVSFLQMRYLSYYHWYVVLQHYIHTWNGRLPCLMFLAFADVRVCVCTRSHLSLRQDVGVSASLAVPHSNSATAPQRRVAGAWALGCCDWALHSVLLVLPRIVKKRLRLPCLCVVIRHQTRRTFQVPESKEAFVAESLSMLHLTPVPASAAASLRAMPPAVQRRWKPGHAAPMRVAVQWVSPAVAVHARTLHTADWTPAWRHSRGATTRMLSLAGVFMPCLSDGRAHLVCVTCRSSGRKCADTVPPRPTPFVSLSCAVACPCGCMLLRVLRGQHGANVA